MEVENFSISKKKYSLVLFCSHSFGNYLMRNGLNPISFLRLKGLFIFIYEDYDHSIGYKQIVEMRFLVSCNKLLSAMIFWLVVFGDYLSL